MEQNIVNLPMESSSTPASLEICQVCQRYTPFTAAILAGKPLGHVCTCAIELRAIKRQNGQARLGHPVEGH